MEGKIEVHVHQHQLEPHFIEWGVPIESQYDLANDLKPGDIVHTNSEMLILRLATLIEFKEIDYNSIILYVYTKDREEPHVVTFDEHGKFKERWPKYTDTDKDPLGGGFFPHRWDECSRRLIHQGQEERKQRLMNQEKNGD